MCSQLTFDSTIFDCQGRSGICGNIACNFAIRPLLPISLYYNRSMRKMLGVSETKAKRMVSKNERGIKNRI